MRGTYDNIKLFDCILSSDEIFLVADRLIFILLTWIYQITYVCITYSFIIIVSMDIL